MTTTPGATTRPLDRLTGWRGDADYFRFQEHDRFDARAVLDVLHGRVAGVVFRNVVAAATATELVRRFWDSPARRRRGGSDCAPAYYLGAYHYQKPTATYLDESEEVAAHLDAVLSVPGEPSAWFRERLATELAASGVTLRRAEHGGRAACPAVIRHWNATGEYALDPHEDLSQCGDPVQADFEIQRTIGRGVCAVNVCLQNGEGGRLVYWNIVPDQASKTRLGVRNSGSPYPPEVLRGIESIQLDIRQGDVYVFNGGHVHGVEASAEAGKRTTLAWLMGFRDDHTVVTWT